MTHLRHIVFFQNYKQNSVNTKCETAGLGSMKGFLEAACGLKAINLTTDTIKILGVHFSYYDTLKVENNFLDTVKSIKQALRFWNSRIFSLEGKIITFKTLPFCKIVYLTFLTVIPNSLIEELRKIKKPRLCGTSHVQKLVTKHNVTTLKMVG